MGLVDIRLSSECQVYNSSKVGTAVQFRKVTAETSRCSKNLSALMPLCSYCCWNMAREFRVQLRDYMQVGGP